MANIRAIHGRKGTTFEVRVRRKGNTRSRVFTTRAEAEAYGMRVEADMVSDKYLAYDPLRELTLGALLTRKTLKALAMDANLINELGDELYAALIYRKMVTPLTSRNLGITIDDAYCIQQRMISRRLEQGERIIGKKIGVTAKAVMNMLGVVQPDFGYMLDSMAYNEGESIPMDTLIQPRAEGEIAFVMKKDVTGPGVTGADILAATEGVMACIEIVDSRIQDWKIKIQDTVSDNASCGAFVLGNRLVDPRHVDLATCGMVLEKNGDIVGTGAGAATLGNPLSAMVWLANTLGRLGISLKAGDVVLSGSLAALIPVKAGDNLRVTIGGIGGCSVRFV